MADIKLKVIIEGWKNHLQTKLGRPPKQIWLDRLSKCLDCEHSNHGKSNACSLCGCYLPAKVKSSSECPLKLW